MHVGLMRSVNMVLGIATAGPVFYLSVQFLNSGRVVSGVLMGLIGLASFFLPGFLMSRFLDGLIGLKRTVLSLLYSHIVSSVKTVIGVGSDISPGSSSESSDSDH